MTTRTSGGDKEAAPTKARRRHKRNRDNNLTNAQGKAGADRFIEELASQPAGKRGAVTEAAHAAYPNQSRDSARSTGSRLSTNPYVQEQVAKRRQAAAEAAGVTRAQVIGILAQMATMSLRDFQDADGQFNWKLAEERGIDHFVQEEDITERHSKDGSKRVTRKYKIPDKIKAMDLLTELTGWKHAPSKNPLDGARENYQHQRQKPDYDDVPDEVLAELVAKNYIGVTAAQILEGQPT